MGYRVILLDLQESNSFEHPKDLDPSPENLGELYDARTEQQEGMFYSSSFDVPVSPRRDDLARMVGMGFLFLNSFASGEDVVYVIQKEANGKWENIPELEPIGG